MMAKEGDTDRKPFKDYFDRKAARMLAEQIASADKSFETKRFVSRASKNLQTLEYNDRIKQFASAMRSTLPTDVPRALEILVKSLPPALPNCDSVTDGWLQWPIGQFIADYGTDHFEESMTAMIQLTQRLTAEYAVRPFVERYPEELFARLGELSEHTSPHVRRWCSEGVRPRLPWGTKLRTLVDDPSPIIPILETLKDDESLYVRKSVANNLNDIAKDNPKVVLKLCKAWKRKSNERRDWVIKHALRTLVKDGNAEALKIIGFGPPKQIEASLSVEPKSIRIGESVQLEAILKNIASRGQDVAIDYAVHYVRKKENQSNAKVFKWKTARIGKKETLQIAKQHAMRETTVRALYPGEHVVELQVNGQRLADTSFIVTKQ